MLGARQGRVTISITEVDRRDALIEAARELICAAYAISGVGVMGRTIPHRVALTVTEPADVGAVPLAIRRIALWASTTISRACPA